MVLNLNTNCNITRFSDHHCRIGAPTVLHKYSHTHVLRKEVGVSQLRRADRRHSRGYNPKQNRTKTA